MIDEVKINKLNKKIMNILEYVFSEISGLQQHIVVHVPVLKKLSDSKSD